MEAHLPDQDSLGANLAQRNDQGKIQIISHASRQLKENKNNYEYLNGSRFTLYRDTTTETALETTQVKTLNHLQTTMNDHDFETRDRQKSDLPNFLRNGQNLEKPGHTSQDEIFNRSIHVDLIDTHTSRVK
jgi:hypothetical protein